MQFLNPMLLWGLLLLVIPIIIHLFYFRRYKEIQFTNVKFLSELKEEKSVRDRLRQILILIARLLALAFLIFAFARPFIPGEKQNTKGNNSVSVYIDNSFSMQAYGDKVAHLDKAKRIAQNIIDTYDSDDEFQLLSNDFDYQDQRWLSKSDALNEIDKIKTSPIPRKLNAVVDRQQQLQETGTNKNKLLYLISDFQQPMLSENLEVDSSYDVNFIAIETSRQPNLSVDSVWLGSPVMEYNQINSLFVKVTNYGNSDIRDAGLRLQYKKQVKPAGVLEVAPGESRIDTMNIVPTKKGIQQAEIRVKDYPVEFDNAYYIAFNVPGNLNVLSLYGENKSDRLHNILRNLQSLKTTTRPVTRIEYSELPSYDLVIVHGAEKISTGLAQSLGTYTKNGGNVLFFPTTSKTSANYEALISAVGGNDYASLIEKENEVYTINRESYVFSSVFEPRSTRMTLPKAYRYYPLKRSGNYSLPLMKFRNGEAFIAQAESGLGFFYQSAVGLSEKSSDLILRTDIFIPMLYRMALQESQESKLSYTIGTDQNIEIIHPGSIVSDEPLKIKGPIEFIPGQHSIGNKYMLDLHDQLTISGIYDMIYNDSLIHKLAFNYDRSESDLSQLTTGEITERYPQVNVISGNEKGAVEKYIQYTSLGTELWRCCLILSLIFLALEQIFIRLLRSD